MSGSTQGPVEETVSATTDGAPLGAAPVSLHLVQLRNGGIICMRPALQRLSGQCLEQLQSA